GLDEVKIKSIQDKWTYVVNLEARKEEVLRIIDEQGKLTDSLAAEIKEATQLQRVEDLYRPYKQKRRTRATIAKEKGLEPLARMILSPSGFQMRQVIGNTFVNTRSNMVPFNPM